MKRFVIILALALLPFARLAGQSVTLGEEAVQAGQQAQIDSTLYGRDVFSVLPEHIIVRQSLEVRRALLAATEANADKTVSGYRIRLFLDSRRTAREQSLTVMSRFHSLYPNIPVFRSFSAPNYKVSVGNFRTRVEAEALMRVLKPEFPDAFIVRDKFPYPSMGKPDMSAGGTEFDNAADIR